MSLSTLLRTLLLLGVTARPPPVEHRHCLNIPENVTRPEAGQFSDVHGSGRYRHGLDFILLSAIYPLHASLLPSIVDYRLSSKVVSPVKDQGSCGSCWAFSSAESLEGQLGLNGHRINVSAQNFVDCVAADAGCGGGWMDDALAYAEKTGVEPAKKYPYTGSDQSCQANTSDADTLIRCPLRPSWPSSDSAEEKAQQDPQDPWSLTGETTFDDKR